MTTPKPTRSKIPNCSLWEPVHTPEPDQLRTSPCYQTPIQGKVCTQGRLATWTHRVGVGPDYGHSWRPMMGMTTLMPACSDDLTMQL